MSWPGVSQRRVATNGIELNIAEAGEGGYTVTTVGGGTFTAAVVDGAVVLTDAAGNTSTVTGTDVEASNGLIHVIDTVLMPQ